MKIKSIYLVELIALISLFSSCANNNDMSGIMYYVLGERVASSVNGSRMASANAESATYTVESSLVGTYNYTNSERVSYSDLASHLFMFAGIPRNSIVSVKIAIKYNDISVYEGTSAAVQISDTSSIYPVTLDLQRVFTQCYLYCNLTTGSQSKGIFYCDLPPYDASNVIKSGSDFKEFTFNENGEVWYCNDVNLYYYNPITKTTSSFNSGIAATVRDLYVYDDYLYYTYGDTTMGQIYKVKKDLTGSAVHPKLQSYGRGGISFSSLCLIHGSSGGEYLASNWYDTTSSLPTTEIYLQSGIPGLNSENKTINVGTLCNLPSGSGVSYLRVNDFMEIDGTLYILFGVGSSIQTALVSYYTGGILAMNLASNGSFTDDYKIYGMCTTPVSVTSKNNKTIKYYSPNGRTNCLYFPQKFVSKKKKKLIFTDEGYRITSKGKYKNTNRIVEFDLNTMSITSATDIDIELSNYSSSWESGYFDIDE
jgi:hypothetical protein